MFRRTLPATLASLSLVAPALAHADCKLIELAEFHVDLRQGVPIVDGAIDGKPVKVMFDTGANLSSLFRHEAERLGLSLGSLNGMRAYGVGGSTPMYYTNVKELRIDQFTKTHMQLPVVGDRDHAHGAAVILGDDFFSQVDVEFDLPDNAVRLFKPQGCSPPQLVYWGAAYSQVTLLPYGRDTPAIHAIASLNGKPVLAELDSGAAASVISMATADVLGATRPPDAESAGKTFHGVGAQPETAFVGRFDSFSLGDETIRNVRLQELNLMGDFKYEATGSLIPRKIDDAPALFLGADFLHAHRVYIDARDHLMLFSYQGGPVFTTATPTPAPN
jgi:predicted aspartyl protease